MTITTCIFDAYGTLFDVGSAARRLAEQPGQDHLAAIWPKLAEDWRLKQLQYSWLRAITGEYVSFWQVTQDGLDWAMEKNGLNDAEMRENLLALYWELAPYPEAPGVLARLKANGKTCAILSNGSADMLEGAVSFAGLDDWLDASLSVQDVGVFKPARGVYDMVGARFGCTPEQVLFVSSNGWDAAGAAGYGFNTVWVNRAGDPVDRLPHQPRHVVHDLTDIVGLAV